METAKQKKETEIHLVDEGVAKLDDVPELCKYSPSMVSYAYSNMCTSRYILHRVVSWNDINFTGGGDVCVCVWGGGGLTYVIVTMVENKNNLVKTPRDKFSVLSEQ